jgi:hypothetical protein
MWVMRVLLRLVAMTGRLARGQQRTPSRYRHCPVLAADGEFQAFHHSLLAQTTGATATQQCEQRDVRDCQ